MTFMLLSSRLRTGYLIVNGNPDVVELTWE